MDKSTNRKRFEEKAYKRVKKITDSFEVLSCFANREFYDYSAVEIMTLFSKIESSLNKARDKYIYELQRAEGTYVDEEEDDD